MHDVRRAGADGKTGDRVAHVSIQARCPYFSVVVCESACGLPVPGLLLGAAFVFCGQAIEIGMVRAV